VREEGKGERSGREREDNTAGRKKMNLKKIVRIWRGYCSYVVMVKLKKNL